MKLNRREWFEAVGVTSVVASLIFVGFQLYYDRQLALATQYGSRAEIRIETIQSWFENDLYIEEWSNAIAEGRTNPPWLTDELKDEFSNGKQDPNEILRSALVSEMQIVSLNNNLFMYQKGFMAEEDWLVYRNAVKGLLTGRLSSAMLKNSFNTPAMGDLIRELEEELALEGT